MKVSGEAPSTFIVATTLVGSLFLLVAITGVMFKLALPGGGSLEPVAQTVKEKPDGLEPVVPEGGPTVDSMPESKNEVWMSLPVDVRGAAEKLWFEWNPSTTTAPAQALVQVDRQKGKGPHPYYLTFQDGVAPQRIMKITLSGRGYTGPRASEDD